MLILLAALAVVNLVLIALLLARANASERGLEKVERTVREELSQSRQESGAGLKSGREELLTTLTKLSHLQEESLERTRATVEGRLKSLQDDNAARLELMRATVDEKLHATLERRLGDSFKIVSERLELVHKGLGEMQSLATGVGDLKKILGNVKVRGLWGEIQLKGLLDQILVKEQYDENVATKEGSRDVVEFAIRLPGRAEGKPVYLPLDSKLPLDDYQRLIEAREQVNLEATAAATKQLEAAIKWEAKEMRDKYLDPPNTTDFGVIYLPVEGLYAEAVQLPGLCDTLQREYRVLMAGPATLAALLSSLQMGFRTLAIEKRSSEVWVLLGAIKAEFGKFGDLLERTQEKLQAAGASIEDAARKSRTIEKKLKNVQELPVEQAQALLDGEKD